MTFNPSCFAQVFQFPFFGLTFSQDVNNDIQKALPFWRVVEKTVQFTAAVGIMFCIGLNSQFHAITILLSISLLKKPAIERCIVDGAAKTQSYKQYLEINIARRRNGRVDRPGLDDDNATSLKHGNEAFLDYMLDSVFVGSK